MSSLFIIPIFFAVYLIVIISWTHNNSALDGDDIDAKVVDIIKYNDVDRCIVLTEDDERILTEEKCVSSIGSNVTIQKQNAYDYYEITGVR